MFTHAPRTSCFSIGCQGGVREHVNDMATLAGCLTDNAVNEFFAGRLSPRAVGELEDHVRGCAACRRLLSAAQSAPTSPGPGVVVAPTDEVIFEPGTLVDDRYRITRFIARGGMGEVYEAHDTDLDERVALKTVSAAIADDGRMMERIRREVQLARRVTHPNVCRIFDVGYHRIEGGERIAFLTMELLDGETLGARVARAGPLTVAEASPLAGQIAAALDAAHAAGVIHRDFKSDNVMLVRSPGGLRAVVTDFGLARPESTAGRSVDVNIGLSNGRVIGTPNYMAPEQARGEPATAASDIYALGVVLYEMVTGTLPFRLGQLAETAAAGETRPQPTSPRRHAPELPARWEQAILCCLSEDPARRFASARALAHGLAPPSTGWRMPATAAALVGALALTGAGWWMRRARPPATRPPISTVAATTAPVAAAATTSPVAATPPATIRPSIRLAVRSDPPDARLWLDDAPIDNPFEASLIRDRARHHVVARARGRQAESRWVLFDQDQTLELRLAREPDPAPRLAKRAAAPITQASAVKETEVNRAGQANKDTAVHGARHANKGHLITSFPENE
jgi:serine/threonine protein kinase